MNQTTNKTCMHDDIKEHLEKIGSSKTDILNEVCWRIDYIKTKTKIYFGEKREFEDILTNSCMHACCILFQKGK